MIRVLLESVPDGARVQASGSFALQGEGGINVIRSERASEVLVRRNGNTLQIQLRPTGEVAAVEGNITIVPGRGADLKFAGVDYAGNIRLQPGGSGEIMVINDLLLETYLEGVLPHEIGNPGPEAYSALEAQAVAARTYAMMKIEQRSDQLFDVHSGVLDQVYRGKERQNQLTTAAVRETRGAVLTAGGKLCRTYYSATCGGHTSDIDFAWPTRESARYLHGVYDKSAANEGAYCSWVHNFRWRYSFSGKELGDILRRTLPDELGIAPESVGSVVDLKVVRRTPSGRSLAITFSTKYGVTGTK